MTELLNPERAPAAAWSVCPGCREILYRPRLVRDLHVCRTCGRHHRVSAQTRIEQLFDPGTVELLPVVVRSVDRLEFIDTEPYPDRLAKARLATGTDEGVLLASGTIHGNPLVAAVMDFGFMGGSVGAAIGGAITEAADLALGRRVPLLLVSASGGARMQEGAIALMQMAKTSQALAELDEAGILTLSLITDPTFGGAAASFATLCDVIIAEPGARLGFAGPRVIEQTIRQKLPPGFQTAEFLLGRGLIDAIRPRRALRGTLARLLSTGTWRGRSGAADEPGRDVVVRDPRCVREIDPWRAVRAARRLDRPTTLDYVGLICDDFEELRGDRTSGDCPAVVGGPARLGSTPVMVIGHQKGHSVAELNARNFGMPAPSGYRKAARLMRLAAKLALPVVTFIDTPGAYPGVEAERDGQAMAIAESIRLMAGLPVPCVAVVIGEGGSGGALAIGVADEVLICADATYSVISPEGCASILWSDPAMAPTAAASLRVGARQLLRLGVVDGVVPEPQDGTGAGHRGAAQLVRTALVHALWRLTTLGPAELRAARRKRFRSFGAALPAESEDGR